jgi:ectoine hydroxylase-related dioxygenase (phytanoyl-CoA dioxygenase family)
MIPRTKRGAQGWLTTVLEGLNCLGCALVEDVVDDELQAAARSGLRQAQQGIEAEVGRERLERAGELGVARLPMRFAPAFFRFLELPEVLAVVDRTVSDTAILHLQNGLVLPPLAADTPDDLFQLNFHMDFRRVLNGSLCSVNTLFAIDAFTRENGATVLVPGTHQKAQAPDAQFLRENAVAVECAAGSMLVFDSTLWHAAGRNQSGRDRLGLNQQFTRSYFKQQIDYVRALGDEVVLAQPPRTQQLLGWYTRVVTSLDDFYQPADRRLYRAGQG